MYHVSIMYDGWVLMCVLEDLAFRNESDVCFVKKTGTWPWLKILQGQILLKPCCDEEKNQT